MRSRVDLLIKAACIGAALSFAVLPSVAQQPKGHGHADHKHGHPKPKHGGIMDDIGEYHAELLVAAGKITIFLGNHEGKDADAEGFKASVLITQGSQRQGPFELKPAGGNKLEGTGPAAAPKGARAIVTLTDKAGKSAQERYELK
jgi:hypothetical protein